MPRQLPSLCHSMRRVHTGQPVQCTRSWSDGLSLAQTFLLHFAQSATVLHCCFFVPILYFKHNFHTSLKLRMCFKTETALEFISYDLNIAANKIIIISCATRWNWRLVTSGFNERCRICTVNICMTAQGKIIGKIGKIIVATFSGNQLHTFVTRFWPHCGWNVPKHRDLKMLEIF